MTLSWATRASVNIRRTMDQRISRAKGAKLVFRAVLKPSDPCSTEPAEREGFETELAPGPLCLDAGNERFSSYYSKQTSFSKTRKAFEKSFYF